MTGAPISSKYSKLRTIVHLVQDVSAIGGISGRVRNTVASARGRIIRHICLSAKGDPAAAALDTFYAEENEAEVLAFLGACHAIDTVVIAPNTVLRAFSPTIQEQLSRLPVLHMASGQLSFILQDTLALAVGTPGKPGQVELWHKYKDFTGEYVLHCHFLGHEDRGMMFNVQTVCKDDPTKWGKSTLDEAPECVPGNLIPASPKCPATAAAAASSASQ